MKKLRKGIVLFIGGLLVFSNVQANEVNDIVYFKLFGKVIGVENVYYYSLQNDGTMEAYVRPEFEKEGEFHTFHFGKVKKSYLESWDKMVERENGHKTSKCGMTVIDIKWADLEYYRVIHDGDEYLSVGSVTSEMPDYFINFICDFEKAIKK